MVFDFTSLLVKLRQLVELTHALRGENAALRTELSALQTENARLALRMHEAHERVSRLIASLPAETDNTAETIDREAA